MTGDVSALKTGFRAPVGVQAPPPMRRMLHVENAATMQDREFESLRIEKELTAGKVLSPLMGKMRTLLDAATRDRRDSGIDTMLKEAQLAMNSQYPKDKLDKITSQGYSDVYLQLTETKFNHFMAWMSEFSTNMAGFGFEVKPTPTPDLSKALAAEVKRQAWLDATQDFEEGHAWPTADDFQTHMDALLEKMGDEVEGELAKRAEEASDAMQREIEDQLEECGFAEVEETCRAHIGGFGTGFLKGPVIRWREKIVWGDDPSNPSISRRAVVTVEAPNPLDIYPVAGAKSLQDGLFERIWITKETLLGYKGLDHYQDAEIDALVSAYPAGKTDSFVDTDAVRAKQELATDRAQNAGGRYEGWVYWGTVLGSELLDFGVTQVEPLKSYPMEVIFIGNHPIKIMPNPNPLGTVPYFPAPLKARIGSIWGKPMYHLMKDAQDIANGSWRAIITGEGMGALPIMEMDWRSVDGSDIRPPHGGMVIRVDGDKVRPGSDAVKVHHIDTKAHELLSLAQHAERLADNATGIPAHTYGGSASGGFDKTASGYMMQLEAASRGLKHTIKGADAAKSGLIANIYNWNMLYSPKAEIKGDAQIVVKGTLKILFESAQQERIKEFLAYVETSPMGQKLVELEGFNKLLHKYADAIHLDASDVLPSEEELKIRMEAEKQALLREMMNQYLIQQGGQPGAPAAAGGGQPGFRMPAGPAERVA